MSKTKANGIAGDEILNQSSGIDSSIEKNADPLPWLIHSLREKQADQPPTAASNATTEPRKDSQ